MGEGWKPRELDEPRAVFDIETVAWDSFFCGAILTAEGACKVYRRADEERMVRDLLALSWGDVYAHNGGRFDFLWLVDAMERYGVLDEGVELSAVESGSSVVALRVKAPGVKVTFRDSFRMFPLSLRKLGGKDEVGLACTMRDPACKEAARVQAGNGLRVEGCGGYCAISHRLGPVERERVVDYCVQDCRALLDGLRRLFRFARDEARLSLGGTTGATAWKTARAWGLIGPTELSTSQWDRVKLGYYGGRTSLFRESASSGFHYDITSSYPYQTTQPLPHGEARVLHSSREARAAFRHARPGVYEAVVTVPDMAIPPLPYRAKVESGKRNAYPVGTFAGSWALPELVHAVELGCKVEPVGAVVFPDELDLFSPLIRHLIDLRLKVGKESAEGALLKLWANSLYGKFAQESPRWRLIIAADSTRVPEGARPLNERMTAWLVPVKGRPPVPACSHIEKAAYITARGRVQLHRMLTARGGDDAVYADTDSCFATSSRDERDGVGSGLGSWSVESGATGRFRNFAALAPKLYRYDAERADGSWKPKLLAKGIALPRHLDELARARTWDTLTSGGELVAEAGVMTLRSALRANGPAFKRKRLARSVSGCTSFGDRIPDGRGGSRPPRADELVPWVDNRG